MRVGLTTADEVEVLAGLRVGEAIVTSGNVLGAPRLTPALAALFIRGRIRKEEDNPLNRWLIALYTPVVRLVVRWRWLVVLAAALAVVATVPALLGLESEFMPPLIFAIWKRRWLGSDGTRL